MTIPSYMLKPIKTKYQATRFITQLTADGLEFHFDDDPREIIGGLSGGLLFDEPTSQALDDRIAEMRVLPDYDMFGKILDILNRGP